MDYITLRYTILMMTDNQKCFVNKMLTLYPSAIAVIFADFWNTCRIFLRDLFDTTGVVLGGMFGVFALLGWKRYKLFSVALATHFIVIVFTVYHWQTTRYFMPEIVCSVILALLYFTNTLIKRYCRCLSLC